MPDKPTAAQQQTMPALKNVVEIGKQWGQYTVKSATVTVNYWWEKYEEFVGLNEVRDAQSKVTEVRFYCFVSLKSSHVYSLGGECLDVL